MNNLVQVTNDRELVVSLDDISKGTGIQTQSILKTIQRHGGDIELDLPKGKFSDKLSLNLTEAQAYKLMMILSNTPQVKKFKLTLVNEFFKMRELIRQGGIISQELKEQIDKFIPKSGYLQENEKGEIKTQSVRGYYRVDKNSRYNQLINKRYQLQKRLNGLLRQDYEIEIKLVEIELNDLKELECITK